MRVVDRHDGNLAYRSQVRQCQSPECARHTREGKPYCPKHVGMNSYAAEVMGRIAEREAEDAYVLRPNTKPETYNTEGETARSILQHLEDRGTRTKERICRELGLDRNVVDAYTDALVIRGLVRLGRTGRGSETLSLR